MTLGETIRRARKRQNISQEDLARILALTTRTLSHYENNRRQPTYKTIVVLCKLFPEVLEKLKEDCNEREEEQSAGWPL